MTHIELGEHIAPGLGIAKSEGPFFVRRVLEQVCAEVKRNGSYMQPGVGIFLMDGNDGDMRVITE